MRNRVAVWLLIMLLAGPALPAVAQTTPASPPPGGSPSQPAVAASPAAEVKPVAAAEPVAEQPRLDLMSMLFVFMLATFIGLQVISRVSRLLHTPLMSLTNAISAIAVVGSIVITGLDHPWYITLMGAVALFASMTNIVSGFLITDRMLKMFKTREVGK